MKIIEKFKKLPKIIQILDIIFIICLLYECILMIMGKPLDLHITTLMLFIIFVDGIFMLKSN